MKAIDPEGVHAIQFPTLSWNSNGSGRFPPKSNPSYHRQVVYGTPRRAVLGVRPGMAALPTVAHLHCETAALRTFMVAGT